MNPNAFLLNLLSPGLPALLNLYKQALSTPTSGATSAGDNPYAQLGGVSNPYDSFSGGQYMPTSYTPVQAFPAYPVQAYPAYPVQQAPAQPQQGTAINFRPVIVQNQTNVLPLHSSGGINATMNAGTSLNVNGTSVFR
jgi:hypothetical protein